MRADELLAYLFEDKSHELSATMAAWLSKSRRFTTFVDAYHDKIRKKIRVIQGSEQARDLQHELETAYLLVREKQFTVAYEPYAGSGSRSFGPDFAVTYTTSFTFNIEATRLRSTLDAAGYPTAPVENDQASAQHLIAERLMDTLCNKLYQLTPNMINIIVIGADGWMLGEPEIAAAMSRLKLRAERQDSGLLAHHGFRSASDFFKHYERLSGVIVHPLQVSGRSMLCLNRQAKQALPSKAATLLRRCFAAEV